MGINWGSAYGYALEGIQGSDFKDGAVKVSRSMYPDIKNLKLYGLPANLENNTQVISTLCYGVQWDQVMRFMTNVKNNYYETNYIIDSSKMGWYAEKSKDEIQLTGKNIDELNNNCVKNIYDMAGNVYEWTMEYTSYKKRVLRGGEYQMGRIYPSASMRATNLPDKNFISYGFRVAIYIN